MPEPSITVLNPELGPLVRLLFGPAPVAPLSADEMRWEDDGGLSRPAQDGYEHFWNAPRQSVGGSLPVAFSWLDDELLPLWVTRARGWG